MGAGNSDAHVPDWCEIAERASRESDPKKLIQLVRALCDRLQEAELKKESGQTRKIWQSPMAGWPNPRPQENRHRLLTINPVHPII
jgi:hypothetical protein